MSRIIFALRQALQIFCYIDHLTVTFADDRQKHSGSPGQPVSQGFLGLSAGSRSSPSSLGLTWVLWARLVSGIRPLVKGGICVALGPLDTFASRTASSRVTPGQAIWGFLDGSSGPLSEKGWAPLQPEPHGRGLGRSPSDSTVPSC